MRKAVARYDASSGKEFMAYFDTIYANAMHEAMNRQSMREQGDIRLNRGRRVFGSVCASCAISRALTRLSCRTPSMIALPIFWMWMRMP